MTYLDNDSKPHLTLSFKEQGKEARGFEGSAAEHLCATRILASEGNPAAGAPDS